jgi:hypothetical protein
LRFWYFCEWQLRYKRALIFEIPIPFWNDAGVLARAFQFKVEARASSRSAK